MLHLQTGAPCPSLHKGSALHVHGREGLSTPQQPTFLRSPSSGELSSIICASGLLCSQSGLTGCWSRILSEVCFGGQ